jgi:hypothetical protein
MSLFSRINFFLPKFQLDGNLTELLLRHRLAQPNVERAVRAHGNLVLRKAMLLSKQQQVTWDSQTRISEAERRTNSQTSKVWTIQMMMTLILTPALNIKTNTD